MEKFDNKLRKDVNQFFYFEYIYVWRIANIYDCHVQQQKFDLFSNWNRKSSKMETLAKNVLSLSVYGLLRSVYALFSFFFVIF